MFSSIIMWASFSFWTDVKASPTVGMSVQPMILTRVAGTTDFNVEFESMIIERTLQ
jgi:hypothetical protein